jgi:hypothetical protein
MLTVEDQILVSRVRDSEMEERIGENRVMKEGIFVVREELLQVVL